MSRTFPNREDLLVWWIWSKLEQATVRDTNDPEMIREWITEFDGSDPKDIHMMLSEYPEFQEKHLGIQSGNGVGDYVGQSFLGP